MSKRTNPEMVHVIQFLTKPFKIKSIANDYSVWDKWEPKDPVTLEEKAQQEALLEKMRNEEFEKSNPDFCNQFKEDLERRQRTTREREKQAESKLTDDNLVSHVVLCLNT